MRDTINQTFGKIKEVISAVPGAGDQPIRAQRYQVNNHVTGYRDDTERVQKDLADLEITVEELRTDVVSRRCRVNQTEVESMALALSNISKSLAELKGKFPKLQDEMKSVMAGEMEVVVHEEKFIKEEPVRLDDSLKRCKKLTGTLFTLKRLADVQDQRPPSIPKIDTAPPSSDDRKAVLQNIQAAIPNHEAAESAIERKKKLTERTEALGFEKSLELAQKQIREKKERENSKPVEPGVSTVEGVELRAHIPLTDTTKRLSLHGSPEHKLQVPLAQPESDGEFTDASSERGSERGGEEGDEEDKHQEPVKGGTGLTNGNTPHLTAPGVQKTAAAPVVQKAAAAPASPRLSTFAPEAPTPARAPLAPPISSSTPKQVLLPGGTLPKHVHVTFSSDVTEISDTPDNGKPRKIPPPPPPRKSSRNAVVKAPSPKNPRQQGARPPSPPTYENIENLGINPEEAAAGSTTKPRSAGAEAARGKAATSPVRPRPMTRYQHELAEGIYANMNRPDLQGQRIRPVDVINNSPKRSDVREVSPASSDSTNTSTSTSSIDSQIGGIVRKIHAPNGTKSPLTAPPAPTQAPVQGDGKVRKGKVPPPPPVRKTSTLSTSGDEGGPENNGTNHKTTSNKYNGKPNNGISGKSPNGKPRLTNGDVKSVTIATDKQVTKTTDKQEQNTIRRVNKTFEETEIY